jgi:fibronectin-binding autotransporter adhesin
MRLPRIAILSAAGLAANVNANPFFWDGADVSVNADGGAGIWNTTSANLNWDFAAFSGSATFWTNASTNNAVFGGVGGAVNLGTGITAGNLAINANGYTFSGSTLTASSLTVASGRTVTFNNTVAGVSNALAVNGGYGSLIDFRASSSSLSSITISSGIARYSTGSSSANGASITVGLGGELQYNTTNPFPTAGSAPAITLNQGLFSVIGGSHAHVGALTLNSALVDLRAGGYHSESFQLNGNVTVGSGASTGTSWLLQSTGSNSDRGIALQSARTFTVNAGSTLVARAELENSDGANGSLTKAGAGTLILLNTSSYGSGTTVNAGVLQLGDISAGGTGTGATTSSLLGSGGTVTVNAGGTLAASHVIVSSTHLGNTLAGAGNLLVRGAGHFHLSGASNTFSGAADIESSGQIYGGLTLDYSASNTTKLASTATLNLRGGNLRLLGNASGATSQTVGALAILGGGVITINPGAGGNLTLVATSLTQSNGGMFTLRSSGTLGTNALLDVGSASLGRWATTQTNTETNTQFLAKNGSNIAVALAWSATGSGGASLASQSETSVYLADTAQSITANLTIDSLGAQANVNLNSGSTLTLAGGGLILRNNSLVIGQSSGRGNLTTGLASGDLYATSGGSEGSSFSITANIADNGATPTRLVKGGTGQLILGDGGANAYSGGTLIQSGRLRLNNAAALGSGAVAVNTGGQLYVNIGSGTLANNLTLAGLGSADGSSSNLGALRLEGSPTVSGNLAVPAHARITLSTGGGTVGFTGILSGSGDLELRSNAGGLSYATFTNAGNTFTGRFIVRDGNSVLRVSSDLALGPVPGSLRTDAIILDGGRIQNGSPSAGASFTLHANRGISLLSPGVDGFFQVWGSQTLTVASPISGPGNLVKSDAGTLVLTGLSPMTGTVAIGSGTLTLNAGGGFTNAGTLRFSGAATLNVSGGTLVASRFVTGDASGASSTVNLSSGMLTVTGTESGQTTGASFLLSHWGTSTSFNIWGGTLNVLGATMNLGWDGTGTLTQTGGEVNTLGIRFDSGRGNAFTYNLNGGRLNLGTSGIGANSSKTFNLGDGTLSALGNWSTSQAINLTSASGGTVDPNARAITLTGGTAGSGKLILNGEGTLNLNAAGTHSGGTDVVNGFLSIGNTASLLSTGTLNIQGGTVSVGALNADLGGTVNLASGTLTGTTGSLTSVSIALTGGTLDALADSTVAITKSGAGAATISKAVAAPVTVSAGTLNLSAAMTGALTINGGTVVATAAPAGTVTLNAGGTLEARTALAVAPTFAGGDLILGPGSSLATGLGLSWSSGKVTVATGGTVGLSNALSVGAGATLAVSGSGTIASALVTLAEGGLLDLSQATSFALAGASQSIVLGRASEAPAQPDVVGAFTLSGGRLNVAGTGAYGVASFGNSLTLSSGVLQLDLASDPLGSNDRIAVAGALTLSGNLDLDIRKVDGVLGTGLYSLITYGEGSSIDTLGLRLLGASGDSRTRQTFSLVDDLVGTLALEVSGDAGNLVWSGSTGAWDYDAEDNWTGGGVDNRFFDQDNVTFDGTVGQGVRHVVLGASLAPNSVVVAADSVDFTFSGSGKLTGTMGLLKTGAGSLTLSNTGGNDFTGATSVAAGSLVLGAANVLSAASTLELAADATLDLSGNSAAAANLTGSGTVTTATAATLSVGGALSFAYGGALQGALSLTKTGAGVLTFTGVSSASGSFQVAEGILQVGAGSTSGTLGATAVAIAEGASLVFNRSDALTQSGDLSRSSPSGVATLRHEGAGALTLSGAITNLSVGHAAAGQLTLSGSVTGSALTHSGSGSLVLSGTLSGSSLTVTGDGNVTLSGAFGSAAITKGGSGTLLVSGSATATSLALNSGVVDVSGTLAGPVVNNASLVFSGATNRTYAGAVSGTGSVTKSGSGELTLSGANTFTGNLAVTGGRLVVASASNLGSGSLTLSGGATLAFTSGLTTGRSLALGSGGAVIEVGSGLTATHNSNVTGGQTLTKAGAGTLNLENYASGGFNSTAIVVEAGTLRFATGRFNTNIGLASVTVRNGATLVNAAAHGMGGYVTATPAIILDAGSTFTLNSEQYINALTINGGLINGGSEIRSDNGFSVTVNGDATWSAGLNLVQRDYLLNVAEGATLAQSGYVSNGRALNKSGAGTVVLSGNNSYSGGTGVNGGVLAASSVADGGGSGSIGTGYLGIGAGGSFRYTGTGSQSTSRVLWIDQSGGASTIEVVESTASLSFTSTAGAISRELVKAGAGALSLADDISGGATVSGGTLTLLGAVSGAVTNNATLVLAGSGVTVASAIGGSGSLVKSGSGAVTLGAVSTFTGGTSVTGGVLVLSAGGQSGALRGTVDVAAGATLRATVQDVTGWGTSGQITALNLNGGTFDIATTANQTLGNAVITLTGGLITGLAGSNIDFFQGASALSTVASATTSVISGATLSIRQSGGLTLTVADGAAEQDLRIESAILSNGSFASAPLVKAGAGLLRLTGANAYTGATTISAGTLEVAGSGTLGTGTYAGAIANSGQLVFSTSSNQVLSGALSGSGTLAKSGSGTLSLTGSSSRSSATSVTGGILAVAQSALGTGSYDIGLEGTLRLNVAATGTLSLANLISGSGLLALNNTGEGTLALSGLSGFSGSIALLAGTFDGSGFGGAYLYQGGRLLDNGSFSGTVEIAPGTTVAIADLPVGGTLVLAAGATLDLTGASGADLGRTITFAGGTLAGAENFTGILQVASGASVSIGASTLGQGKLVVAGNSTVTFTETVTNLVTFSGGSIVNGANLRNLEIASGASLALGADIDALSAQATVRVSGGTLDLGGAAVAASIDFRGGSVSGAAGFAGTLTVTAGQSPVTLVVNGVIGGTVEAGANAIIAGNGTFNSLSLASGSTLSPGNSPGEVNVSELVIGGGSTWVFQAFSTQSSVAEGRGYDTITVAQGGQLDLSGASAGNRITLQLMTLSAWSDNVSGQAGVASGIDFEAARENPLLFDLATFDTGTGLVLAEGLNITSLFAFDASGFIWSNGTTASSGQFSVFLRELGDGRTALTMRAIPEPSTYGLILGGLALAGAALRRRRKVAG